MEAWKYLNVTAAPDKVKSINYRKEECKAKQQAFALVVKMLVGMPSSSIGVLGFKSWLCSPL